MLATKAGAGYGDDMKLKDYLRHKGENQASFAERVGLHQSSVSRLADGEIRPSMQTMIAIEAATDGWVTLADFAEQHAASAPDAITEQPEGEDGQ